MPHRNSLMLHYTYRGAETHPTMNLKKLTPKDANYSLSFPYISTLLRLSVPNCHSLWLQLVGIAASWVRGILLVWIQCQNHNSNGLQQVTIRALRAWSEDKRFYVHSSTSVLKIKLGKTVVMSLEYQQIIIIQIMYPPTESHEWTSNGMSKALEKNQSYLPSTRRK